MLIEEERSLLNVFSKILTFGDDLSDSYSCFDLSLATDAASCSFSSFISSKYVEIALGSSSVLILKECKVTSYLVVQVIEINETQT